MNEILKLVFGSTSDIATLIFFGLRLSKRMLMKDRGWYNSCIYRFYGQKKTTIAKNAILIDESFNFFPIHIKVIYNFHFPFQFI